MKIAIIGGGFTGLTAAYRLTKEGHSVTVFEKEPVLGGLAYGFKQKNWNWSLEYAYHHLFTNDEAIISLIKEIGLAEKLIIKRPITSTLYKDKLYQLDSAKSLLEFPGMPISGRIRTGALIAAMKLNPFWQPLEHFTAKEVFQTIGGEAGWKAIWEPLMVGKFGDFADTIAASWLWARIKKRTPSLAYIEGGFQTLINTLEKKIKEQGGKILTNTAISTIQPLSTSEKQFNNVTREQFEVDYGKKQEKFDRILVTAPTPLAAKLISPLASQRSAMEAYFQKPLTIPHLHAQVLILETEEAVVPGNMYWLNITDRSYPFLAVVDHTHYMDKKDYGGHHITYIGNYLPPTHPYIKLSKEELLKKFWPYLKKINPSLPSQPTTHNSFLFTGPFAQPVHQKNYSTRAPALITPIPGLYLANMDSIYPWDRGTNYAVELGEKAAATLKLS